MESARDDTGPRWTKAEFGRRGLDDPQTSVQCRVEYMMRKPPQDALMAQLADACSNQWPFTAAALIDVLDIPAEEFAQFTNDMFHAACRDGRYWTARWIASKYKQTRAGAREMDDYAFIWARRGGHNKIADWLMTGLGLEERTMRRGLEQARSCRQKKTAAVLEKRLADAG
jgi:hypothetical protein